MRNIFSVLFGLTSIVLAFRIYIVIIRFYQFHQDFISTYKIPSYNGMAFLVNKLLLVIVALIACISAISRKPIAWYIFNVMTFFSIFAECYNFALLLDNHIIVSVKVISYIIICFALYKESVKNYFGIRYGKFPKGITAALCIVGFLMFIVVVKSGFIYAQ